MQAVVLVGGMGTRMLPLTDQLPKAMLPVHGRPFIDYQLELLRAGGVTDIVLCVGHLGEQIRAHVGDGASSGLRVRYSVESEGLRGTGGALKLAEPLLEDIFLLTWGDSYVRVGHREMYKHHRSLHGIAATMGVYRNVGRYDRSNVAFRDGVVRRYVKGAHGADDLEYIDAGVSVLNKHVLDDIPEGIRWPLEELFASHAASGRLAGYVVRWRFFEVGSRLGYADFQRFIGRTQRGDD